MPALRHFLITATSLIATSLMLLAQALSAHEADCSLGQETTPKELSMCQQLAKSGNTEDAYQLGIAYIYSHAIHPHAQGNSHTHLSKAGQWLEPLPAQRYQRANMLHKALNQRLIR